MDTPSEKAVARFIGKYERLCRRHQMMVMMKDNEGGYHQFRVAILELGAINQLEQALEEMRLGDPFPLGPRED